jgi:hypothetical protein
MIVLLVATATWSVAASHCPSTKPTKARFRTIAWVNTTCRTDANGLVGHQEIYVQRGEREATVVSRGAIGPVPDPLGLCRAFAEGHDGIVSLLAGAYTAVAVSPDGNHVAFELNDAFSLLAPGVLTNEDDGIYLVRADGTERVRLAPPNRVPVYRQPGFDLNPNGIVFSPDGRYIVYSDLGPADDGSVDAQLWSLRIADRKTTQLTRLARHAGGTVPLGYWFHFADERTVGMFTLDYYAPDEPGYDPGYGGRRQEFYSVSVDGRRFQKLSPVLGPNGQVIPQFGVTRHRPAAAGLILDGTADNPMNGIIAPRELFVARGRNVLQLTHFNRVDVGNTDPVVSANGQHVYFAASADPFGCNPTNNCQTFSIDTLGGHLRQLTAIAVGTPNDGCFGPRCRVVPFAQDAVTGTVLLNTACDPFGTNVNGNNVFAIRPDGSGLRQITHARGLVVDTPDVVEVELPGPGAYQRTLQ